MQIFPERRCASTMRSASARLRLIGISTCTCLPFDSVRIVCSACSALGVARITASTPGRSMQASRSVEENGIRHSAANALPLSCVRLLTATISTPSIFCSAFMWITPMAPVPARQIFMPPPTMPPDHTTSDISVGERAISGYPSPYPPDVVVVRRAEFPPERRLLARDHKQVCGREPDRPVHGERRRTGEPCPHQHSHC